MSAAAPRMFKRCDCGEAAWRRCADGWHLAMSHKSKRWAVSFDNHLRLYEPTRARPTTRAEADVLCGELVAAIRTGTYPPKPALPVVTAPVGDTTLTFEAAAKTFVEQALEPRDDIEAEHVAHVKAYLARYERTKLPEVGLAKLVPMAAFNEELAGALYLLTTKGMANSTKHKYRDALRGLLEWATRKGHLASAAVPTTVAARGKQMPAGEDYRRTRRIDRKEEADLLEAAREARADSAARMTILLPVAFDTGGRKGELLALQWRDLRFDEGTNGRIHFAAREKGARKSEEARFVPMTDRVREALARLPARDPAGKPWKPTAYIFGDVTGEKKSSIEKAWTTIRFRAWRLEPEWTVKNGLTDACQVTLDEVIDLKFHDIRHECALRWHREEKFSLGTISNLLGHKDLTTLRVYLGMAQHDALDEVESKRGGCHTAATLQQTGTERGLRVVGGKGVRPAK